MGDQNPESDDTSEETEPLLPCPPCSYLEWGMKGPHTGGPLNPSHPLQCPSLHHGASFDTGSGGY